MQDISVNELKKKLDDADDFIFIDVREQHEYDDFNLGATLIPLNVLPTRIEEFKPHIDKEIVFHCRSGSRSGVAKTLFERSGFTKVRNLTGGVLAWKKEFFED